jgi:hypothetical protein
MRADVSEQAIEFYRDNGFLAIDDFLFDFELADWIDGRRGPPDARPTFDAR